MLPLDQVRDVPRVRHYRLEVEETYLDGGAGVSPKAGAPLLPLSTPCLEEKVRNNERTRILDVMPKSVLQLHEFGLSGKFLRQDSLTEVLCKLQENATSRMPGRIDVEDRVYADVHDTRLAQ